MSGRTWPPGRGIKGMTTKGKKKVLVRGIGVWGLALAVLAAPADGNRVELFRNGDLVLSLTDFQVIDTTLFLPLRPAASALGIKAMPDTGTRTVFLRAGAEVVVVRTDDPAVRWGTERTSLRMGPLWTPQEVYLPHQVFTEVLSRVLGEEVRVEHPALTGGSRLSDAMSSSSSPEPPDRRNPVDVIMLDPGHGGHDSGAQRGGTIEKEVVLAFSKVLRDRLKATGRYNVLMTRDDDTFVELDDRRAFAERHQASLFMAIHADYAGSRASGATIYSLRDRVADELQRSAAGEVARNVLSDTELQAIKRIEVADTDAVRGFLADLAQREVAVTHERTNVFARSIIEFMGDATPMMNNPDRSAAFRVLKTAKVPSVLVELAYVTNKQDAANLKSESWRQKVADSLVTAIDNYFTHQVARLPM
jgi:N-acetylmuramoyl-L-alanine amidase